MTNKPPPTHRGGGGYHIKGVWEFVGTGGRGSTWGREGGRGGTWGREGGGDAEGVNHKAVMWETGIAPTTPPPPPLPHPPSLPPYPGFDWQLTPQWAGWGEGEGVRG